MMDIGSMLYDTPDLYNPLWIDVTLCFTLIIIGNLSTYLEASEKGKFHFDFSLVQKGFTLVFGLAFIVPGLIILFFFFFGFKMSFRNAVGIMAIYSYSNVFFIFGSIITLVPIKLVDLVAMGIAAFLSLLFLNLNYSRFIN